MSERTTPLTSLLDETFDGVHQALREHRPGFTAREAGLVKSVGRGIAQVSGLPGVWDQEVVRFGGGALGMVFNLDADSVGIILLDHGGSLSAGDEARRTGRVLDVPVGHALIGRVVDTLGRPLDGQGPISTSQRREVDRDAAPIIHRAPVEEPLQTGIKVVDALLPIGRGQRELIVGDRQTGKTSLALDTILNQRNTGVICVYCFIGQPVSSVARFVEELRARDAMRYTIVVSADGEDPPALQYLAPYAATSMAEYFMESGSDALIVYDDLTRHAWAYRELSLLLRRPPGREAFPGDIFYIHARLLERATRMREEYGGGSLTALPIVETEAQNLSAYIPTNIISITDGQIYLSPTLFQRGMLPAVEVGRSVSRVGGKAQAPAYRAVAGDLRLSYSQFEELETFARFGARLDEETRRTLAHGRRVREILKQPQYAPVPMEEQIATLLAVTEGAMEGVPLEAIAEAERAVRERVRRDLKDVTAGIRAGEKLSDDDRSALLETAREALAGIGEGTGDAGA